MPSDAPSPNEASQGALPRRSVPSDRAAIARAIGRAFFDDPIAVFLFPQTARRADCFGRFAEIAMQQFEGEGATYVSDPVRGAAIWQAPSPTPPAAWAQIRIAIRLAWMLGRSTGRAIALNEVMEANHYSEPHWYLAILGVEPESQGQGLGAKLIQPILDRCDDDRVDAYLESSKESNIPFYRRFGFEQTGEIQVPDGPTLWPMLRKPR